MKIDAAILIGDRGKFFPVQGGNKNFLDLHGLPLFFYSIKALEESPYINRIFIVGDQARIKNTIAGHSRALKTPDKIIALEQKRNLFENVFVAFEEALSVERKNNRSAEWTGEEKAMLYMPGDTPLIAAQEIDEFIEQCDVNSIDYFLGMSTEEGLKPFYPTKKERGIKMAYFYVKGKKYRQNNLHLIKPFKIQNRHCIQRMYDYRYQKQVIYFLKLLLAFYRAHLQRRGIYYFLILHWNLFLARIGLESLTPPFRRMISLEGIEEVIRNFLGCRFKIVETKLPGAALDIDNEKDYETMKIQFHFWRDYQSDLIDAFLKSRLPIESAQ
ncbi:MAG: NTP transferase domain-containing protein [Thermodesulfobacteriota bacterium]|jgi:CMP-N-acetylneuraminic acid synthetase|nr:MAG: NTP transferase domain-containing protein [Thermodesulfobacteriota bacterium]